MSRPSPARFSLDRRALARAFERAAPGYDAAAWLQRRAGEELLERLGFFTLAPQRVLDLGAGTCHATRALAQRYRQAEVLAIDLAAGMLRAAPRAWWARHAYRRICADGYALPLPDASVDLIYSNLMLQWCDRPEQLFAECSRVLSTAGLLVFSSFGPQSLEELRAAWAEVDASVHVSEFPDMPEVASALMHAGFVEPVLDLECVRRGYPDARALMRELKQLGAHNAASDRSRGLTGRARLAAMTAAYERRRTGSGLPATFQLLYGAAFKGTRGAPGQSGAPGDAAAGEFVVPLDRLRRR
ncbi:MAG TPA: malonyl-ACP O-methyltransferase BioC [Steroidobacteraceae bacterium]|nr:malonyl-ACP O-methyltransferase BioC [Steroidobacteraceae bacterium]